MVGHRGCEFNHCGVKVKQFHLELFFLFVMLWFVLRPRTRW